ncbi:MAG: histidine--tRNA ligase [Candidatus Paceibacterota bacterium]|nr:histidine--tRNA ligase [Candidatus Paceibacterota bacterium]
MQNDKQKVSTESYKGVRDFYPADMSIQNYIFGIMRKTSENFGYSEYGASVLESAELYRAKSGDEIVNEQTYTFKDRGDRDVSLRPEMTPTVARMIAAKLKEFSFPLRWYSIPNLFRYEKPQRGRTREHWQLNVDIFGVKNINADVEVISIASKIMQNFGLKESDFEIKINNRKIVNFILNDLFDLSEEISHKVAKIIDKKNKISEETFNATIKDLLSDKSSAFIELLNTKNFEEFVSKLPQNETTQEGIVETKEIIKKLEDLGIKNVVFSQDLMRGFDYYTGMIFEVFDKNPENRRAIFGGGRYDELLAIFDKETVPAVGFGMGDVVIKDILETYGLLPKITPASNLHICVMNEKSIGYAQDLAQKIRENDIKVTVDYSEKRIGDQIKYADKNKIPFIICIGEEEIETGKFKVKELSTGIETETTEDQIYKIISL